MNWLKGLNIKKLLLCWCFPEYRRTNQRIKVFLSVICTQDTEKDCSVYLEGELTGPQQGPLVLFTCGRNLSQVISVLFCLFGPNWCQLVDSFSSQMIDPSNIREITFHFPFGNFCTQDENNGVL